MITFTNTGAMGPRYSAVEFTRASNGGLSIQLKPGPEASHTKNPDCILDAASARFLRDELNRVLVDPPAKAPTFTGAL